MEEVELEREENARGGSGKEGQEDIEPEAEKGEASNEQTGLHGVESQLNTKSMAHDANEAGRGFGA